MIIFDQGVLGVPLLLWVCISTIRRTDVREAGLWRWELTASRTSHCHRDTVSHMDLLLRRRHSDTKFAEQVTNPCHEREIDRDSSAKHQVVRKYLPPLIYAHAFDLQP